VDPTASKSINCDEFPSAKGAFASTFPFDPRKDRDDQNESYVSVEEDAFEDAKL
jgi:hypothetical protein